MTLLAAPALPLHTAGKYVAAAYIVFVVMLVVYLGIMALRTGRTRRELSELRQELAERQATDEPAGSSAGPTPARRGENLTEPEREVAR
jgi:flagellar biosynthesis/type III secretory pathway M-ring protein FliF/YscJ